MGEAQSPSFEKMVLLPSPAYQNLIAKVEQKSSPPVGSQSVTQGGANLTHIDVNEGATLQLESGRSGAPLISRQGGANSAEGSKGRAKPPTVGPGEKKGKKAANPPVMSKASAGAKGAKEAALARSVFARAGPIPQTVVKGDAFRDDLAAVRKRGDLRHFVADRLATLEGRKRKGDKLLPVGNWKQARQAGAPLPDSDVDMRDMSAVFPAEATTTPSEPAEVAPATTENGPLQKESDLSPPSAMEVEGPAVDREGEADAARVSSADTDRLSSSNEIREEKHDSPSDASLAENIGEQIVQSLPLQYQSDVPPPSAQVKAVRRPTQWEKEVGKEIQGKRGKKRALAAFDEMEEQVKRAAAERSLLPAPSGKVRMRDPSSDKVISSRRRRREGPSEDLAPVVTFPDDEDEEMNEERRSPSRRVSAPQKKRTAKRALLGDLSEKRGRRAAIKREAEGDGADRVSPKRKAIALQERSSLTYEGREPERKKKEKKALTWEGTRLARKRKGEEDEEEEWAGDLKRQRMNRGEKRKRPSSKLIYPPSKKRWWDWESEEERGSGKYPKIPVKSPRPVQPHKHAHHYWAANDHLIAEDFPMW